MAERVLSSSLTFACKFVSPTVSLCITAGGGVALFMLGHTEGGLMCGAAAVLCVLVALRRGYSLKRVTATDEGLVISNYLAQALVPYKDIVQVCESNWFPVVLQVPEFRTPTVVLILKNGSRFGKKIRFLPRGLFVRPGHEEHPVTAWLRERCNV